jgi:hypothetical protein
MIGNVFVQESLFSQNSQEECCSFVCQGDESQQRGVEAGKHCRRGGEHREKLKSPARI